MEKVLYILWRKPDVDVETFGARLRSQLAPQLKKLGARGLKLNVYDATVAPAAGIRQIHTQPPIEALAQVWVDSAIAHLRKPVDDAIAAHVDSFAAYLVTESQPLRNEKHPPKAGERTTGFAQLAFLRRPEKLTCAEWLDIWHNSHTHVAVETQSNFEYIQNVVVRALTPEAPAIDAVVEECFPAAAMADPYVFFDASGDEAKFKHNLARMMDSVNRFIEPGRLDVAPSSQYLMF